LFYQVFQALPDCYFELIGAPGQTAAGYTFTSEELKQAGRRLDGVFVPGQPGQPVHFVEVFFYKAAHAYANLFAKVFLWLEKKDPAQDWHACLIFASKNLEPPEATPYRALLASDQVTRIYLDKLPPPGEQQIGLGLLEMIVAPPEQALAQARAWLGRVPQVKKSVAQRRQLIELIELILLGHFPRLNRKELERMLQIKDFRETKVYQEALEEGLEKGLKEGREEIAVRLLAKQFAVAEVAELTGLPLPRVKRLKKQQSGNR
jgi:predicted transposase/invertase (TIGR01784 family)